MKTQSTYSMLVNSKEKGRDCFEVAVYAAVALCAVALGFQGLTQTNNLRDQATAAITLKVTPAADADDSTVVAQAPAAKPTRG